MHLPQVIVAANVGNRLLIKTQGLRSIDRWCGRCLTIGQSMQDVEHMGLGWHARFQRQFDRARVVVAHAGTGTMIECMLRGTPVIVMPRSAALHETRNDHQFATARKFATRSGVFVAWDETELPALLDRAATLAGGTAIKPHADESLLTALRAFAAE